MRSPKKSVALLLVLALCLSLTLSLADGAEPAGPEAPAVSEVPASVAATLGDYTVRVAEVESDYYSFITYMSYYGLGAPSTAEEVAEYVEMIVDTKISDLALAWQADRLGLTLTSEKEAEVEASFLEQKEGIETSYRDAAAQELGADATEEEIAARANAQLEADVMEYMGCDFASYLDIFRENLMIGAKGEMLEQNVKAGVTLSETDAADWFAKAVASDKTEIEKDPLTYRDIVEGFEAGQTDIPAFYAPAGFIRVQTIEVGMDETTAAAHEANVKRMGELEAEFGALALRDTDPERREAIRAEYAGLVAADEALLNNVKERAAGICNEVLTSNMTFAGIAAKYTEGLTEEEAAKGRLMYTAGEDPAFPAELCKAAAALGDGEVSEVIEAGSAYYIVRRVNAVAQGTVGFENVRELVEKQALHDKQETVWSETSAAYIEEAAKLAVKYPAHYANVGQQ